MASVIIFGPTGNVGSYAARTAQELGAKVFLAMRDTKKQIPGLSPEEEEKGNYERIQADLSKPDSVTAAVESSGAKRAFIYLIWGVDLQPSMIALKTAGIEFVTFLSSFTVAGKAKVTPADLIPYAHLHVENILDEVFGEENCVAIRPGGFATNIVRHKDDIAAGEFKSYGPEFPVDCITPGDMGRVSGTVLAQGPKNNQRKIYLYGPQILTHGTACQAVGKVIGKDVKVTLISEQEQLDAHARDGLPKHLSEYMVKLFNNEKNGIPHHRPEYDTGVKNVELYTGRPSMAFEDWVKDNMGLFGG